MFVNLTTRPIEVRDGLVFSPTRFYLNGEPTTAFRPVEFTIPPLSVLLAKEIDRQAPWPVRERFEVDER